MSSNWALPQTRRSSRRTLRRCPSSRSRRPALTLTIPDMKCTDMVVDVDSTRSPSSAGSTVTIKAHPCPTSRCSTGQSSPHFPSPMDTEPPSPRSPGTPYTSISRFFAYLESTAGATLTRFPSAKRSMSLSAAHAYHPTSRSLPVLFSRTAPLARQEHRVRNTTVSGPEDLGLREKKNKEALCARLENANAFILQSVSNRPSLPVSLDIFASPQLNVPPHLHPNTVSSSSSWPGSDIEHWAAEVSDSAA